MASPRRDKMVIPESEYTFEAVRARGPGGQHVNKVSTAAVLRFDIAASSLPEDVKQRLLASGSRRITAAGILVIRSGSRRSLLQNKAAALARLHDIVRKAATPKKKRKPTAPTAISVEKRLESKTRRSEIKQHRRKVQ